MKMSKNFKQYNTEWAKLGYPKKPWYIKDCGCGEVAIANCITEMVDYASETPKTIQPWCKQYAAPNGDGTYWSAPPTMMAHYGMTECQEHQTMASLWKELAKGNRVAIYLMSNRLAGSKKIKWTGSKHFICSTNYRYDEKTGKHWVYVKDSNSTSESRNGWVTYEDDLRNAVYKVWSGKLIIPYVPSTPYTGSLPSGTVKKGSKGSDVKATQTFLNWCINAKLAVDGNCGNLTDKAIRKYQTQYKLKVDGIFGPASKKKAQEIVNKYAPTPVPAPAPKEQTLADKILDACKAQAEWSKNSKYKWQKDPTIAKSKNYETCVTYTACVGQRVDIIPSGKFIWHNSKGKVVGATDNFEIIYPGKKLRDLKGVLKAGDFVMDGDKADLESGSHIFIVTGEWKDGCPIVWDNHSAQQKKMAYKYTRNRPVIAIARPKVR